jgi:hypothetical protein
MLKTKTFLGSLVKIKGTALNTDDDMVAVVICETKSHS